jgi:tetratricopeptide (TPR) repeat protein
MRLFLNLIQQMKHWDRASRTALFVALALFIVLMGLSLLGQPELQTPLLIGGVGLLIVMQVVVMWGNRHMVTPFHAAQRAYLAGEFAKAQQLLEDDITQHHNEGKQPPVDHLVLLGNLYRQRGELEQSAETLRQALELEPSYHFPLYGYGRTLLVMGDYETAASFMQQSIEAGAPNNIRADVVYALYRAQAWDDLQAMLPDVNKQALEPYRHLMMVWVEHRIAQTVFSLSAFPIEAYAFWDAELERYKNNPLAQSYCQALRHDLEAMRS